MWNTNYWKCNVCDVKISTLFYRSANIAVCADWEHIRKLFIMLVTKYRMKRVTYDFFTLYLLSNPHMMNVSDLLWYCSRHTSSPFLKHYFIGNLQWFMEYVKSAVKLYLLFVICYWFFRCSALSSLDIIFI